RRNRPSRSRARRRSRFRRRPREPRRSARAQRARARASRPLLRTRRLRRSGFAPADNGAAPALRLSIAPEDRIAAPTPAFRQAEYHPPVRQRASPFAAGAASRFATPARATARTRAAPAARSTDLRNTLAG